MTNSRGERPCGSERGQLGPGRGAGSGGPGVRPREAARAGVGGVRPGMFQKQVPDRRGKRTVCLPTCLVFLEIFKEGRPVSEQGGGHVSAYRTRSAQDACPLASTFAKRAVPKEKVPPLQEGVGASGLVISPAKIISGGRRGCYTDSRPRTASRPQATRRPLLLQSHPSPVTA